MFHGALIDILAFPLNLFLFLVWVMGCLSLWKRKRTGRFVRFMLSPRATVIAIGLFIVCSLIMGLTGWRVFSRTWIFVAVLLYFQTVLLFVLLRGWGRWRFVLLHLGLLVAVASSFWGAPDNKTSQMRVYVDDPSSEHMVLNSFNVTYDDAGMPSDYTADMEIDGKDVVLEVNDPYQRSLTETIYLVGYDAEAGPYPSSCIIQIVREPYRYITLCGIVMMLAGAVLLFLGGPRKKMTSRP